MRKIILLLCALVLSLPAVCQENYNFGRLGLETVSKYEYTPQEGEYSKNYCFTLLEDADVIFSLFGGTSENLILLMDSEENMTTPKTIEPTRDSYRVFANLPAGNYEVMFEYTDLYYGCFSIETLRPNIRRSAIDLGTFDSSFEDSRELDVEDKFSVFHSASTQSGMACYKLELSRNMNLSVDLKESTVKSGNLIVQEEYRELESISSSDSLPSCSFQNLAKGTYYFLTGSDDETGRVVLHVEGSCENSKDDNGNNDGDNKADSIDTSGLSGNYAIERKYMSSTGESWNDKNIYYDDMGREQETVLVQNSPSGQDLISLVEYDDYDRVEKEWLPISTNRTGGFISPDDFKSLSSSQYDGDAYAYSRSVYEPSQRIVKVKSYGAGEPWHKGDKATLSKCLVNDPMVGSLDCMRYTACGGIGSRAIKCEGSYPTGCLLVTETTDEDGHKSYEFKDVQGNVVLKRQEADGEFADTYYIYDSWGNPLAVLPPMASREMCVSNKSWAENSDIISSYAYLFAYDNQYRKIGTKLPGCDWTYTIYDNADTPVLTQDGEQRKKGEWSFGISDVWGRPCLEGVCKNSFQVGTSLPNTSAVYSGASANYGYTIKGIALTSPTFHKVIFYDNYDFLGDSSLGMESLAYASSDDTDYNTMVEERSKGKETGSITAVDDQMENAIKSVTYYDYRGRNIQTNSTNHLGGMDKLYMAYDFTDHVTKQRQVHTVPGNPAFTTDLAYTYDHAGRLLTTTMSVNNSAPTTISSMEYDELGRLVAENRNGNEKLRTTYSYNIRQWTKNIGGKLFNESLFYNESHNGVNGLYNGNISSVDWSAGDNESKERGYGFCYDKLSRLTAANYYEDGKKNGNYSTSYSYDLMGNIESLTRNGLLDDKSYGKIDDLTYEYNGNQVTKITDKVSGPYYKGSMHFVDGTDAEIEYEYDKNGCMTKDLNKKIGKIEYNLLNLPTKLSFEDGSIISYSYDADGNKLTANYNLSLMNVVKGTSNNSQAGNGVTTHRDYCGNFIYEDGVSKMMLFNGGYAAFDNSNTPQYHFYLKDHLGNNRVVADANGNIEQVNHYYPFGSLMAERTGDTQPYKYNGKELDHIHGLDSYDYGARWMIDGRFTTRDPHAIDYVEVSSYAFCKNNPIRLMDDDGKDPGDFFYSIDAAAIDFALIYNEQSIVTNTEYMTNIIAVSNENGELGFTYTLPNQGTEYNCINEIDFSNHPVSAVAHTHGGYNSIDGINTCDYFSGKVYIREGKVMMREDNSLKSVENKPGKLASDIGSANKSQKIIYVATPCGTLQKYEPEKGTIKKVSNSIPSDARDPKRVNSIPSIVGRRQPSSYDSIFKIIKLMMNSPKYKSTNGKF